MNRCTFQSWKEEILDALKLVVYGESYSSASQTFDILGKFSATKTAAAADQSKGNTEQMPGPKYVMTKMQSQPEIFGIFTYVVLSKNYK